ncbi:ABC transporter substrate-binding protein [Ferrigenium kumadai]|uniref:ABC transporter substrate-binding protein n=1 Tax=Ferrigenium kumadai TaxID=1682490 RepID=A0AAN1T150_9PROT|nr:NrtA/SsuA/CpmA family ABC transporter substrate-binding protein [Ferrigenium kumadai]BBI99479.1 ABC transporter substrate-binding protein [Ferrigenium kumadai]
MVRLNAQLLATIFVAGATLATAWYFIRTPPPAQAEPRDAVRIALPMHPTSLIAHVALERGFFAANGLDVSVKEYPSGKIALDKGLFAGQADIAWSNETPVALAGFERADFRIVSTTLSANNVNMIIARRDRGIERPEDLRGKRIATQKGSAVHFFLHLFLLEHEMTEKDVRISFLKAEELPAALASGAVDAFSMRAPYISQARALLGEDQSIVFRAPEIYDQMDLMLIRLDLFEMNPRVARKAVRAMLDAENYIAAHPEETTVYLARQLKIDPGEVEEILHDLRPNVSLSQSLLVLLEAEARWAIRTGMTDRKKVPDYLNLIDVDDLKSLKPEVVTIIR